MIITFSHPKGGVGKSLLAFNYSVYCENKRENPIVIDLDGQHSISNFNKLRVAKSNLKPLNIKTFSSIDELANFLNNVSENQKIIIDTGGFDSSFNRVALTFADKIVTPVSDNPVELMRLYDFSQILKEISAATGREVKALIALNRIHVSLKNNIVKEQFANVDNFIFLKSIVRDRAKIKYSVTDGLSVFDEKKSLKDSKANSELKELFKEINKI